MKKACSFEFSRLAISWPPWVRVWPGWASYRFLPFIVFFILACPFVSRVISFICDVRVRRVVSMFNGPLILCVGQFVSVCCPAVLLSAEWIVSCTRITCIQHLSRCSLTFLASSFFSESVALFFSLFLFFSTMQLFFFFSFFFFFNLWLIGHFVTAC